MSLLEMNNQIQAISNEFNARIEGRIDLYRKADKEIFYSAKKVVFSNLKYAMRLPQNADYDLTNAEELILQAVNEGRALASYNLANQFVWLKRHLRLTRHYMAIHNQFMSDFKRWDKQLEKIINESDKLAPSKAKKKLVLQAYDLQGEIYTEMHGGGEIVPYEPIKGGTWIDVFIHSEFKMSKHDALQLLTLEHDDLYTLQQISEVPDELDQRGFEQLIFLARAEKDSESLFFDMYMEKMMKALDESKELREKTWDAFTEVFGPVPTYSAVTDELGNVISMEQNKPNLKVISTVKKEG